MMTLCWENPSFFYSSDDHLPVTMCSPSDFLPLHHQSALSEITKMARKLSVPVVTTHREALVLFCDDHHGELGAPWVDQNFDLDPDTPNRNSVFESNIDRIATVEMTHEPAEVPVALYDKDGHKTSQPGILIYWRRDFSLVEVGYVKSVVPPKADEP